MIFIMKKSFSKCSKTFQKLLFLMEGTDRIISRQAFGVSEKYLLEILVNVCDI